MKRILIIAPHFPPSNLASVHRSRLFAQHLPEFGWEPIILTVHHDHYEEDLDWNLAKLVPKDLRVERVGALPVRPVRIIGDIGVRGFAPMLRRILKIIDEEGINFLYITVPSFYAAPLGRIANRLRGVPYGIDYIDPWVHEWTGIERFPNKHWISRRLADVLEPPTVRRVSLITGVAEGYYADVLARNPDIDPVTAAMPYGGEKHDHDMVRSLEVEPYLFTRSPDRFQLLYAGALLPKAVEPLDRVFRTIAANRELFRGVRFQFVGTGSSTSNPEGHQIRPLAERYGLWGSAVREHPTRIPYLDVLAHLGEASAAFVLGSTEPHYTPSKVYQAVLAERPVFAVLHEASTACSVIRETRAGQVLSFGGPADVERIEAEFADAFRAFRSLAASFDPGAVNRQAFEGYSARSVTRRLADALEEALDRHRHDDIRARHTTLDDI